MAINFYGPVKIGTQVTVESGASYTRTKVEQGGVYNEYGMAGEEVTEDAPPENVINSILKWLMEEKDEKGNYIFTEQFQWFAVYRVLNEKMNFPQKMTEFVRVIQDLGLAELRVSCVYASIKQGSSLCPKLSVKVDLWDTYKNLSEQYGKMNNVAQLLLKKIAL